MDQKPWGVIYVPYLDDGQASRILRYMREIGIAVIRITSDEILSGELTDKRFVGVIYPYGDRFPADIFEPLSMFHKSHGHICWLGGVPFRKPVVPDGGGSWYVDLEKRIEGLPCWLHLLNEGRVFVQ